MFYGSKAYMGFFGLNWVILVMYEPICKLYVLTLKCMRLYVYNGVIGVYLLSDKNGNMMI